MGKRITDFLETSKSTCQSAETAIPFTWWGLESARSRAALERLQKKCRMRCSCIRLKGCAQRVQRQRATEETAVADTASNNYRMIQRMSVRRIHTSGIYIRMHSAACKLPYLGRRGRRCAVYTIQFTLLSQYTQLCTTIYTIVYYYILEHSLLSYYTPLSLYTVRIYIYTHIYT